MLLLNRKIGERIVIGEDIVVTVVKVQGSQVRLGIEAPLSASIRKELLLLDPSDGARSWAGVARRVPAGDVS
jgi:carbon storage regulator CsrA